MKEISSVINKKSGIAYGITSFEGNIFKTFLMVGNQKHYLSEFNSQEEAFIFIHNKAKQLIEAKQQELLNLLDNLPE